MNNSISHHLSLFLLLFFLCSCGNASTEEELTNDNEIVAGNEALKEEVIAIHDEVMPKMGALKRHQKRLSDEATELKSKNTEHYKEEIAQRKHMVKELEEAYDGMFVWMRQFKPHELDDMDEDEGRAYLLKQKVKVEKVNEDIKSALSRAEETTLVE